LYSKTSLSLPSFIQRSRDIVLRHKRYTVSEINTVDVSTLYTYLPLHLVKGKLIGPVEKTFVIKTTFIVVSQNKALFLKNNNNNIIIVYTGHVKMFVICFLLDSFIMFENYVYTCIYTVTGIPLVVKYAPLVADLFLFCYESEFMKNLSKSNDLILIEKFNNT